MKIRQGFVSNSSSSSFLIIGLEKEWRGDNSLVESILRAEKVPFEDNDDGDDEFYEQHGQFDYPSKAGFKFYGSEREIYYLGWDAKELFERNKTLHQIKIELQEKVLQELDIKIALDKINLHFGETGSG